MMDNQSNYEGKSKSFKTIIIIICILIVGTVFIVFSTARILTNDNVHFMGINDSENKKNDVSEEVTTTTNKIDDIEVLDLSSDKYLFFEITNKEEETKDLELKLNLTDNNGNETNKEFELLAIPSGYTTFAYFKKENLGDYKDYKYEIKSSNSIYKEAVSSDYVSLEENDINDNYVFTNKSDKTLNEVSFIIIYFDSKNNIEKISEKYLYNVLPNSDTDIVINDDNQFEIHILQSYYFK